MESDTPAKQGDGSSSCDDDAATAALLEAALREIPSFEKAAYREALQESPALLASESPFARFLVTEQHHSLKAAKRLCRYWQERRDIFRERAFLPMNQTGSGALDAEDVALLNWAVYVILPPDADTKHKNRTVIALDVTRFNGSPYEYRPERGDDKYHQSKVRCSFYMLQVATENPITQTVGVAALPIQQSDVTNKKTVGRYVSLIQNAMPIRHMEAHMVVMPSRIQRHKLSAMSWTIDYLLSLKLSVLGLFSKMAKVHNGRTDEEVLHKLVQCGFRKRCLPTWFGGSWTLQNFQTWQKRRLRIEQQQGAQQQQQQQQQRDELGSSSSNDNIKSKQAAQSNAIRSKKKRQRRKQELESLQEQKRQLTDMNASLRHTNRRYQQLLSYAETEIAVLTDIPLPPLSGQQRLDPTFHQSMSMLCEAARRFDDDDDDEGEEEPSSCAATGMAFPEAAAAAAAAATTEDEDNNPCKDGADPQLGRCFSPFVASLEHMAYLDDVVGAPPLLPLHHLEGGQSSSSAMEWKEDDDDDDNASQQLLLQENPPAGMEEGLVGPVDDEAGDAAPPLLPQLHLEGLSSSSEWEFADDDDADISQMMLQENPPGKEGFVGQLDEVGDAATTSTT